MVCPFLFSPLHLQAAPGLFLSAVGDRPAISAAAARLEALGAAGLERSPTFTEEAAALRELLREGVVSLLLDKAVAVGGGGARVRGGVARCPCLAEQAFR